MGVRKLIGPTLPEWTTSDALPIFRGVAISEFQAISVREFGKPAFFNRSTGDEIYLAAERGWLLL